jgi:hypothetical protein
VELPELLTAIRTLHEKIRGAVTAACESSELEELARVAADIEGDTIYSVDRVSESVLLDFFEREVACHVPIVLIAEGLDGGQIVLPRGTADADARWRIVMDPIDGTRGLMYQKRPAWILTGVAPNRGPATALGDIELAVQTELPLLKQHLCDVLWARKGGGLQAERVNRLTGERRALALRPSAAASVEHGYAQLVRFFPGIREELAAIDDEILRGALGPPRRGKAQCFEDQYISTGGQLYELIAGRDRFTADLRPLMERVLARRGLALGICCHPYDLCTELLAREAGVLVTDEAGRNVSAPLDVNSEVTWIGYANAAIRAQIEPLLQAALRTRGLLA